MKVKYQSSQDSSTEFGLNHYGKIEAAERTLKYDTP